MFVVVGLLVASVAGAKEVTKPFTVEGWECTGCAKKTVKALGEIKGVKSATSNFDKKQVTVVFEDTQTSSNEISAAIKKLKFGCEDE